MQGLVARSMVREIRAVVCGERAEDFAEPAAAVDDSSLSGGSEHERRSCRILVEQRVSGAGRVPSVRFRRRAAFRYGRAAAVEQMAALDV
jgi:hypothetical protein